MPNCEYCGEEIGYLPFKCKYCGGTFCKVHRLPENHECTFALQHTTRRIASSRKSRKLYPDINKERRDTLEFEERDAWKKSKYEKRQEREQARAKKLYNRTQSQRMFSFERKNTTIYLLLVIFISSIVALVFPQFFCLSSYTLLDFYLWTLFTSLFVSYSSSYIGILFLLILVLIFYSIIKNIELTFGTRFLFTLYLVSSLGTALVYFAIWVALIAIVPDPYTIPFIGLASGALLGMICFMIFFNLNQEFMFLFFFLPIRMKGKILIWLLILIRLIPGLLFAIIDFRYLAIYIPELGGILASYIFYKIKFRLSF